MKKRNPQDTTLRNIRALKKRVSKLEDEVNLIKRRLIARDNYRYGSWK